MPCAHQLISAVSQAVPLNLPFAIRRLAQTNALRPPSSILDSPSAASRSDLIRPYPTLQIFRPSSTGSQSQRNSVPRRWWNWSRCDQSAGQRSALPVVALAEMGGPAESFASPKTWPCVTCPLRGQTESQRNSVHQSNPRVRLFHWPSSAFDSKLGA
jgi:hypothetical protein